MTDQAKPEEVKIPENPPAPTPPAAAPVQPPKDPAVARADEAKETFLRQRRQLYEAGDPPAIVDKDGKRVPIKKPPFEP